MKSGGYSGLCRAAQLAARRGQQMVAADQLLARCAGARGGDLGGIDALPVVEAGRSDALGGEQRVEARGSGLAAGAGLRGDPFGDREAVGTVGADRAGGAALRPAGGVEARRNPAVVILEAAGTVVERNAGDRRWCGSRCR